MFIIICKPYITGQEYKNIYIIYMFNESTNNVDYIITVCCY